ncbi:MAG: hypothetical protein WA821_18030 [Anaerolineales bacterium]
MNWWSKIKKTAFFVLFFLFLGFMAYIILLGPLTFAGKKFCTLLGALGTGIDVRFSHTEMPKSYEIVVNSPGGAQKIICPNGGATSEYSSKCTGGGAFIADSFDYPPEDYSVTVHANDKTFTQKMDPGSCLDASSVNGKGCPPFCYRSSVTIDLSP